MIGGATETCKPNANERRKHENFSGVPPACSPGKSLELLSAEIAGNPFVSTYPRKSF